MTRLFAAIAFLCLVATPAAAQCVSVDMAREQLAAHPVTPHWLEGQALTSAGEFYNSVPPESSLVIGTAVLVDLPDGTGILGVGPVGAICGRVHIPADRYPTVRRALMGGDA